MAREILLTCVLCVTLEKEITSATAANVSRWILYNVLLTKVAVTFFDNFTKCSLIWCNSEDVGLCAISLTLSNIIIYERQ